MSPKRKLSEQDKKRRKKEYNRNYILTPDQVEQKRISNRNRQKEIRSNTVVRRLDFSVSASNLAQPVASSSNSLEDPPLLANCLSANNEPFNCEVYFSPPNKKCRLNVSVILCYVYFQIWFIYFLFILYSLRMLLNPNNLLLRLP